MGLSFASFERSIARKRARTEATIEDDEHDVRGLEGECEETTRKKEYSLRGHIQTFRQRLEDLAGQSAEAAALANPDDQIEAFVRERFDRWFRRLSAIDDPALRERLWRLIPDSLFKRVQEAFCRDYVVPSYHIIREERIHFDPRPQFDCIGPGPCLLSADLLCKETLKTLGVADFEPRMTTLERLQRKHDAIPTFKETLASTRQIDPNVGRLHVVVAPRLGEASYGKTGPRPEAIGKLLLFSEDVAGTQANGQRKQRMQVLTAYSAYRKTHHEEACYESEVAKLERLKLRLGLQNRRLNTLTRDTPPDERGPVEEKTKEELLAVAEELATCIDVCKRLAYARLDTHTDLCAEVRGRRVKNVSATMASMVGAINDLQRRFERTRPKNTANMDDRQIIHREIQQGEAVMDAYRTQLQAKAEPLMRLAQAAVFRPPRAGEGLFPDRNATGVERRMKELIDPKELEALLVAPFSTFARKILALHGELSPALEARDGQRFNETLVKMHVIGKMQEVSRCLERLRIALMTPERLLLSHIHGSITHVRTLFEAFQVRPDIVVESYTEAFANVCALLTHIDTTLTAALEGGDCALSEDPALGDMLDDLLAIDLEAIVRNLDLTAPVAVSHDSEQQP
ncbi:TPA: hypothetical protein DCS34_01560 [Candidatus Peribacteria bacterium]|nr:MAG: hypothetical protein A2529_05160 [Candidatus Peribacteria bacterium RIFOXYD2_FULL_58_15]HAS33980.1 hypothetical protein [Candidatus Peribacteria bacterium]